MPAQTSSNWFSYFSIKTNWLMRPLLNSRLHWLNSATLILIRFKGRKSGNEFVTPVSYSELGDCIAIPLSETGNRHWWRNYREPWPMDIRFKGRWRSGEAVWVEPGSEEYVDRFNQLFRRKPVVARILGVGRFDAETGLSPEQVETLRANTTGIVKFTDEETRSG